MEDDWDAFERSVAYLREVAALYRSAFGAGARSVTRTHLDEANNQAQQALELLASNLLNASMAVVGALEQQESEAESLQHKVDCVRQTVRDRQAAMDDEAVQRFYAAHLQDRPAAYSPRHRDVLQQPQSPSWSP